MKRTLLLLALALVLPAAARAGDVTMVARDIPLGPRLLQEASPPPPRFNMLGLHWQGPGIVSYRTRSSAGRWRSWRTADADSGPDAGSSEANPLWHDGNLDWTGTAAGVQFRIHGAVSRLRAFYLWSRVTKRPSRVLSIAGSPSIVPRTAWEADEKIVRARPRYAATLELAVVHHTAGTNDYTPAQAPAIVRGIEVYHVRANGWNDIGYNFLVDRFGTVYEGRGGGITRNVIGAHSLGFNTGTAGVALIGNFSSAAPPPPMQDALVRLLAWRLDIAHLDPRSAVAYRSGGNFKFKAGKVVMLRAISGHRDTGPTECPGNRAYALLGTIASRVAQTGLPKLYAPVVTGAIGGDVRFQATLSSSLPWTVTVTSSLGKVVAQQTGLSALVDWTWNSSKAGKGPFTWTIAGSPSLLPANGSLGVVAPPAAPAKPVAPPAPATPATPAVPPALLSGLTVAPTVLTPTADNAGATVTVDFVLGSAALMTVQVVGPPGTTVAPLTLLSANVAAGQSSFQWDVSALANGRYDVVVTAQPAAGTAVTQSIPLVVDRTLLNFSVTPTPFSPNGDGVNDTMTFGFTLGQPVPVQVVVQRAGTVVATVLSAQLGPGAQSLNWDGTSGGARLSDGSYVAVVTATDSFGTVSLLQPFTIDTTAPVLTLVDGPTLRFTLGEAATVTAVVNGQTVAVPAQPGSFAVPWSGGTVTSYTVQARDAAGNLSATVSGP